MQLVLALAALCGADDREDLLDAVRKAAEAASYTFKVETRFEMTFGNAPRGAPPLMEGKYEKDVGLHLKVGDRAELFQKGEKTYIKTPQSGWQDVPFPPQRGGLPPAPGPGPPGRGSMFGRMFRNLKPPHEEIPAFEKGLKEVKKAESPGKIGELECVIYAGDFTDEAMKNSPLGRMLPQFQGGGPGITGRARAWIDGAGALIQYELTTTVSMEFQGNAIEFSIVRTISLSESGKTRVEIPEDLKKLLGEKSEDPQRKPDF